MDQSTPAIQWIVQSNLTQTTYLEELRKACKDIGVEYKEVAIIPFSHELTGFDVMPGNIYYGSTTFNRLVYDNPATRSGIFFDPVAFSMENYIAQWGRHMLNAEAVVLTFRELMEKDYDDEKLLFIRPDKDDKVFAGEVKQFSDIVRWYGQLSALNMDLTPDTKIIVSEPYNIQYEWRLWVVDKKVVAASKYREYFKLTQEMGCPDEVITFAEARCQEYTPQDVFVMDICLCGDTYYIVECGCMNGAGFYKADISRIVSAVSAWVKSSKL